jgi:hypothetical protein
MKKSGFRHLMYGWLAVVVLALTSCDSENVTPISRATQVLATVWALAMETILVCSTRKSMALVFRWS